MSGKEAIQKAYESILRNDFEQAAGWFEQAIRCEPDNAAYYHKLSITLARNGKLLKALEQAHTAALLAPDNEVFTGHWRHLQARQRTVQAEAYISQRQVAKAIPLLKQAVQDDPLLAQAHGLLAAAYEAAGEPKLAVQAAREALRLEPQQAEATLVLSRISNNIQKGD